MKILIISLPDHAARRAPLIATLEGAGIAHEVFPAIDGRAGFPEQMAALVDTDALAALPRPLTNGEIACALSHALACRHIAEDLREPAIILEDDAIIGADFTEVVTSGALEAAGRDLILLYHNRTRVLRGWAQAICGRFQLRRPIKQPYGAVGYFVTPATARRIADQSLPIADVADWGLDILELDTVCIVPRIVGHPPVEPQQTTMRERADIMKHARVRKRGLFSKLTDFGYVRYAFQKWRSEWIYRD
ncbi:MAG: glycosyltransferase family 25 protein [Paracoccaceae bacterium]